MYELFFLSHPVILIDSRLIPWYKRLQVGSAIVRAEEELCEEMDNATGKGSEALRAKLTVRVLADELVIAETDDEVVWQKVLSLVTQKDAGVGLTEGAQGAIRSEAREREFGELDAGDPVASFAKYLEIGVAEVRGACGPVAEPPYLHFDEHYWESFRKNIPGHGRGSVAPAALAATLLCLWFKTAGIDKPVTNKACSDTLATIGLRDRNAARSIKNSDWLQVRGSGIIVNPANISKAKAIAVAYCKQQPLTK